MKKPKSEREKTLIATLIIVVIAGFFFYLFSEPIIRYLSEKP